MKRYEVFVTRPAKGGGAIWARVGSAVENRDATIQVYLDSLPIDGKLFMRAPVSEPSVPIADPFSEENLKRMRMGQPLVGPKKEEPERVNHALHNGLAVCGFSPDGPSHWGHNHTWSKVGDPLVDCARCKQLTSDEAFGGRGQ